MKPIIPLLTLCFLCAQTSADEITRTAKFPTVAAFVEALKTFKPATSKSDLAPTFSILAPPEDPKEGTPILATTMETCESLWDYETHALVFASARPPTSATNTTVAVLFLLTQQDGQWRIAESLRFTAHGLYAGISAELTADAGAGWTLKSPVITIKESHGGRGLSYQISASYRLIDKKLKRLDLE